MPYTSTEQLQWLIELDRYITLRRRIGGAEPSIGYPDGADVNLPRVYFVDSVHGAVNNSGLRPDLAITTLQAAHDLCTAGRNDFIICLPGHVESLATASVITLSKSGITVLGMGAGNTRPTFTWTATAATWLVSGANVTIKNILCTSTIAAVVKLFSVTGAYVTFDAVDYVEDGTTDCLQFILTTATADFLTVKNSTWIRDVTSASAVSAWIGLVGADYCKVLDNYGTMKGTAANSADGFVVGSTTLSKGVEIARNTFIITTSTGAIPISLLASSTGHVHDNRVASAKTAIAGQVACASAFAAENYVCNTVNLSGLLDPVVDS